MADKKENIDPVAEAQRELEEAQRMERIMSALANQEIHRKTIGITMEATIDTEEASEYLKEKYNMDVEEHEIRAFYNTKYPVLPRDDDTEKRKEYLEKLAENSNIALGKLSRAKIEKAKTAPRKVVVVEKELDGAKKQLQEARDAYTSAKAKYDEKTKELKEFNKKHQNVKVSDWDTTIHNDKLYEKLKKLKAEVNSARKELDKCAINVKNKRYYVNRLTIERDAAVKTYAIKKMNTKSTNKSKKREASGVVNSSPIPQKVLDAAKESGAHIVYLEDEKGNRIYQLRVGKEPNGRTQSVMTEMKGGEILGPIEAKNSKEVRDLLNTARGKAGKKGADFSDIITEMAKKVEATAEVKEVTVVGDKNKVKKHSIIVPEVKAPELPKEIKIKFTPTVTLIPHTKRNGKPSKRKFDAIELMDADGKKFWLTKDMMDKAIKQQGNAAATREEMVDASWDNYVKMAKEGKLQPETVASFFKGQVNMGNDEQVVATGNQKEAAEKGKNRTQKLAGKTKEALKDLPGVKVEVVNLTPAQMKQMGFDKGRS